MCGTSVGGAPGLAGGRPALSADVGDDLFVVDLVAGGADFSGATGADLVGDGPVPLGFEKGLEARPERFEAVGFEAAFEDGELHAHAIVFTKLCDFMETFRIGNIVGDDGEHLFFSTAVTGRLAGRWV